MSGKVVETRYGMVEGCEEKSCYVFKGIPYARPPVDRLRWCAPQKPYKHTGVFKADTYGNRCPQIDWDFIEDDLYKKEFYEDKVYATPLSEDCLYLNIWAPKHGCEQKYPVLFYIHGGGFGGGCGHEVEFRTDAYAKRGVVLVTINYRLGLLGFLAHPWLKQEDAMAYGNYGILDQIAALDWVRENIGAFGGDRNNITICGQSAGGASVITLLAAKAAQGKFQRAIIQSASGYPQLLLKDGSDGGLANAAAERVTSVLGAASLKDLRDVPFDDMLRVQREIMLECFRSGARIPFGPLVNGMFLQNSIDESVERGTLAAVPTIIGSTKNDIMVTREEAQAGDSKMGRSCVGWSLMNEKRQENPAYVYFFARELPGDDNGAFHSSELWYTMGTLAECWRPMSRQDYQLADRLLNFWTNFCKTGNPNGDAEKQEWKKCSSDTPYVQFLDIT